MLVAEKLKGILKDRQLSVKQLSALSGVCQASIRNYRTGRSLPTLSRLQKLAQALNVEIKDLL